MLRAPANQAYPNPNPNPAPNEPADFTFRLD
jgi:hypothetical protein